ncbi:unnamed protein product, partial [Pylaiella littoralis]
MENGMAGAGSRGGGGGAGGGDAMKEPDMAPFLSACFTELRAKGMHEPRVFTHPTSLTEIRQLWRDVCDDGVHKLKEQESPHLIAGIVVWHLKRQPEPLVPYSLYSLVVAAGAGAAAAAEAAARRLQQHDEQDDDDEDDGAERVTRHVGEAGNAAGVMGDAGGA